MGAEHQRLKTVLHEVSQLTLALVRGHVQHRKRTPGTTLNIGPILARTVRHFFPELNNWIDEIERPALPPVRSSTTTLPGVVGAELFLCKLSSRRQLDFQLNTDGPQVLNNLNRLAGTAQSQPAGEQTLDYFLGQIGAQPVAGLRHADGPAVDPHEGPGRRRGCKGGPWS